MGTRKKRVRLYALSTCPECKRLKKYLDGHNIDYEITEVDLLDSGEQWVTTKDLRKYNPDATYPTLVIEEVITGLDEEAIQAALNLK